MAESGSTARGAGPAGRLSVRQRQCLELVAEGYTSKQIARALGLSPSTVDNHLSAAVERMGLGSRADAARALRGTTSEPDPSDASSAVRETHEPFRGAEAVPTERQAEARHPSSLRLPPIGGAENRMSLGRRYFHVIQIALLGTMVMTAVVMTIAGLVQLFSR